MADQSHLDGKYFVSHDKYNCPFCNRRHVTYRLENVSEFHWTWDKICWVYFIKCGSCTKRSMHLSFSKIYFHGSAGRLHLDIGRGQDSNELDDAFFYSVPTSFFVLDERIPRKLRELLTEAEGSLDGNFLTGASACLRKIVYELASLNGMTDGNYEDRIKSLKEQYPEVDGTYFDTLLTIQRTTSSKVHENAYDGWETKHVRLILRSLREILHELYVVPALRDDRRKGMLALQQELLGNNASSPEREPESGSEETKDPST